MRMKKRLTQHEEFEIFKIVLDKLLLLALLMLGVGFFKLTVDPSYVAWQGLTFVILGFVLVAILLVIIIKEFEILR